MKFYALLVILLVVQSLAQYSQYTPPAPTFTCFGIAGNTAGVCSNGGTCVGTNLCACFSGRAGSQCEVTAPATCRIFGPPQPLVTNYPPFIDSTSTFFMNDTLHLVVNMPIVRDRKAVVISIQNSVNPVCRYPGTYFMNTINTTGDCFNSYIANIPFTDGVNCGWNVTSVTDPITGNVTLRVFSGFVYVTYLEKIDAGEKKQVLRVVRSALPLELRFPVVMNETIPIVGPGESQSAISQVLFVLGQKAKEKKYGYESLPFVPDSGVLRFVTAVPGPFQLDPASAMTIATPAGLTTSGVTLVPAASNCTSPTSSFCNQAWQVLLEIDTACSFSGTYIFNFTQICQVGAVGCNATGLPRVQFVFIVDMLDFCTTISLNVPLNGFLETSTNMNFTTLTSQFPRGGTVYARAIVNSPQASITATTIKRVSIVNNDTVLLYNRHLTQAGSTNNFMLIPSGISNQAIFKFSLINLPIPPGVSPLTINALVNVQYTSISEAGMQTYSMDMMYQQQVPPNRGAQQEIGYNTDVSVGDQVENSGVVSAKFVSVWLVASLLFSLVLFY